MCCQQEMYPCAYYTNFKKGEVNPFLIVEELWNSGGKTERERERERESLERRKQQRRRDIDWRAEGFEGWDDDG